MSQARIAFSLFMLLGIGACADSGESGRGSDSAPAAGREEAEASSSRPSTDHLGSFSGVDPGGIHEFRLDVRENSVTFVMWNGFDATRCRGTVPGGVRPRSTRVVLDCGSDMAIAGVRAGLSMDYSGGTWNVYGTDAFSGLSATLRRR
jgi:hypothetical protein